MATFTSSNAAETMEFGRRFAERVQTGEALALTGPGGGGKTQFAKGLVQGMGSKEPVTSPTFTLVHEYTGGRLPIYHFDFYRIENLPALRAIGVDEIIFGNGVSVIEWADRFTEAIPSQARWIKFEIVSEAQRRIEISHEIVGL